MGYEPHWQKLGGGGCRGFQHPPPLEQLPYYTLVLGETHTSILRKSYKD